MEYNFNPTTFLKKFNEVYQELYDNYDCVEGYREAIHIFDNMLSNNESFRQFVISFNDMRQDIISSDRESASFIFTINELR